MNFPAVSIMSKDKMPARKISDPHTEDGIKMLCRSNGSRFFFLTAAGKIYYMNESLIALTGWANPPLYIPLVSTNPVSSIWVDNDGDLFVGIKNDSLLIITGAGNHLPEDGKMNEEGYFVSAQITKNVRRIYIDGNPEICRFSKDKSSGDILLGTSTGLLRLNKRSGKTERLGEKWSKSSVITGLIPASNGNIWYSTLDSGMAMYDAATKKYFFFNEKNRKTPVNSFCQKSETEFFVSVADSLPAIFNTEDNQFSFLTDTIFNRSENRTTDIRLDGFGNLFVIKGGALYYSNSFTESKKFSGIELDSSVYAPFIWDMQINHRPYFEMAKVNAMLPDIKEIELKHDQNLLEFSYSLIEFWNKQGVNIEWKLDGLNMDWVELSQEQQDKFRTKYIPPLEPGKYVFRLRARVGNENWRKEEAALSIVVDPPFWQARWFWITIIGSVIAIGLFFYIRYVVTKKQKEKEKAIHEKELVELEAKALRAQMNPHFVFNSLNSIKSLINKNENETAASYLTTFSKLIRSLFQNSDRREVSLKEELETCRLYTQLEKMRFGDKLEFFFDIDESIDLKDFKVPALIIQPFIENAIWHGLMPKETGGEVTISVKRSNGAIQCIIDDNGVGREQSEKFKPQFEAPHQSKGIGLTQSRLELDKLLNEREDAIYIIDKEDENGKPEGTKVIITFKEG